MTSKLDEIKQRHANGYKGIDAERVFPDVAALLDEIERLRADLNFAEAQVKIASDSLDRVVTENHAFADENEQLRADEAMYQRVIEEAGANAREYLAEIEQLRAALEQIAAVEPGPQKVAQWAKRTAAAALDSDKPRYMEQP